MDLVAERRFHSNFHSALKKRLDSLHYCQPLSLDSAALVQKLLTDLLKTTQGFQQLKKANSDLSRQAKAAHDAKAPLESQVARLHKQNNSLHLSLMSTKEQTSSTDSAWRASLQRAQTENSDLKFVINSLKQENKRVQKENSSLKSRLEKLMTKNFIPSQPRSRNEEFQIGRTLPPVNFTRFVSANEDWANALRLADERTRRVQEELENYIRNQPVREQEISRLKENLGVREAEIQRLTLLLNGGPSLDGIQSRYLTETAEATIKDLQAKIDFLNSENQGMEERLKKANQSLGQFFGQEKKSKNIQEAMAQLRQQNQFLKGKLEQLENQLQGAAENQQIRRLNIEKSQLIDTIRSLQLELDKLRDEASMANTLKAAYNSDKKAYADALGRVDDERQHLNQKMSDLKSLNADLEKQLKQEKQSTSLIEVQNRNLKREIQIVQQSYTRANKDHVSVTQQTYSLRQQISSLDSQKAFLAGQIENLNFELEKAHKQRRTAQQQLQKYRMIDLKAKSEIDSSSAAKQKLEVLYENSQKQLAGVKEQNAHLARLRQTDRTAILQFQQKIRDSNAELAAAQHHIRVVQQQHASVSEQLSQALEKVRKSQSQFQIYQKQLTQLRPLKPKYQSIIQQSKTLQESSMLNREDLQRLQKQISHLEDQLQAKQNRIKELCDTIQVNKQDRENLFRRIDALQTQAYQLNTSAKHSGVLQSQTEALKVQVQESREKEREAIRELEQIKAELRRNLQSQKQNERQLQRAIDQRDASEAEGARLKELVGNLQTQDSLSHNDRLKLEQRVFQSELELQDFKRQLSQETHKRFRLEDQIKQLQQALESQKTHVSSLNDQNNQLKSLIQNLERVREDLLKKLHSSNYERTVEQQSKTSLLNEISGLRKQLLRRETQTSDLQSALRNIDQQRDYVQGLLDQKTQQLSSLESTIQTYQNQVVHLQDSVANLQQKDSSSSKRIEQRQLQIKRLSDKSEHLQLQLDEAKAAYASSYRQIQQLRQQIVAITKQNQYVNQQLMKATQQKQNIKQYYDQVSRNDKLNQQMVRSIQREKEDLLLTYRKACEQNQRLSTSMQALNSEYKGLYAKLQACEQELVTAQSHIAQQEHAIHSYQQDIATLERQSSHLTHQLENADRRLQQALQAKQFAMKDVNSARQMSVNLESNREDLQRQIASVENDKLILNSKLRTAQSELSALKSQLEFEQQKNVEIEQILAKERENLFTAQLTVEKLESMKGGQSDEHLQEMLQREKDQVMQLEMELMKLREDSGKSKHQLYKAESTIKDLERELGKTRTAYSQRDEW